MNLTTRWKTVNGRMFRKPNAFIAEYDETHGISYPLQFILLTAVVAMTPLVLLTVTFNLSAPTEAAIGAAIFLGFSVVLWIQSIVEAMLVHAVVYLFGARNATTTLEAYAFPSLVRYGLWWFPIVNIGLGLYGWYLQIRALSTFHGLSTGKAALAALVGLLLYLPVFVIIVAVVGAFVLDLGGTA